jgi:hypothetical protein
MSTAVGAHAQFHHPADLASTHSQQRDLHDRGVSSHARSVDHLSDKAASAASEVTNAHREPNNSPSSVYVHAYEHTESSYTYSASGVGEVQQASSSDIAAGNILGFITNQLARDVADGASPEELESRIEAGLSGFLQGYKQASDELEDAGLLSEEVEADIQQTYDKVIEGVEKLKSQLLNGEESVQGALASSSTEESSRPASIRPLAEGYGRTSESYYASQSIAQSNSLSFTVTTLDGDKVTINSSGLQAMMEEGFVFGGSGSSGVMYGASQYQEHNFDFSVEGHLDEGEMAALTDLLSQVNDLAETFFTGDLEDAFNEALSLGYDSSEISGFALNLSQTTVQRSAAAYQSVAESSSGGLANRLRPLGSMVQGLMEATETAKAFQYPQQLISSVAEQIEAAKAQQDRFKPFIERLMEAMPG